MTTPNDDTLNLQTLQPPVAPRTPQEEPAGPRVPSWAQRPSETPREAVLGWLADCCAVALGVFLGSVLAVAFCAAAFVVWFG